MLNGTTYIVTAFNSDEGVYFDTKFGYGPTPFDFELLNVKTNVEYFEDGPQLFTGPTADPVYIAGTYTLVGDQKEGNGIGGTLVISTDALAPTPEPRSFVLLGTGALGLLGAARRRFRAC